MGEAFGIVLIVGCYVAMAAIMFIAARTPWLQSRRERMIFCYERVQPMHQL